jgi:hypothetical protein
MQKNMSPLISKVCNLFGKTLHMKINVQHKYEVQNAFMYSAGYVLVNKVQSTVHQNTQTILCTG